MNLVLRHSVPTDEREQIAEIVGCRMADGACVIHQPRAWERRRPGCPYVDSLLRYARSRGAA
ncbi:MAG: hypothetical protein ACOYBY_02410 [Dermatophilaceae bacterium]